MEQKNHACGEFKASSSRLHKRSAHQVRVFLLPMNRPALLERDSMVSVLRTTTPTDRPTESFFSPLQVSKSTSAVLLCSTRLLRTPLPMVPRNSQSSLEEEESTAVLRSTLVSSQSVELMVRPLLRDLMALVRDALNIMLWDADSQNVELFSRLVMDCHLKLPSKRPLTLLLD